MALKIQSKRFVRLGLRAGKARYLLMTTLVMVTGVIAVLPPIIASAAPDMMYVTRNFNDLGLTPDRQTPSGGSTIGTTTLSESVVGANAVSGFYQWEGLQGAVTSSSSIEAKLYIDPNWASKTVTAGLWGVTQSNKAADGSAWPIIAYTNQSGNGHFEMYDTMVTGDWTALPVMVTPGQSYTLEIAFNSTNKTYDYYINSTKVGSETAVDSTASGDTFDHFTGVIFDNYNNAVTGNDYTVQWSDFATGFAQPSGLQMLDNTKNTYAPLSAGVVPNTSNPKQFDLTWNATPGADHYITTAYLNGNPVGNPGWTGTPNSWVYGNGFAQYGDGSYTFQVCAYTASRVAVCTMSDAYIYDTTKPQLTVNNPLQNGYVNNAGSVSISATDANKLGKVTYVVYSGNTIVASATWNPTGASSTTLSKTIGQLGLAEGTYTLKATAYDAAGNYTIVQNYGFTVDTTAPTATINNTTPASLYGSTVNVHAIDTNYQQTDLYTVGDSVPFKTYTGEYFGLFWLSDGNYRMVVRDKAGNSTEYDFTIDKTAPVQPTLVSPADGIVTKGASITQVWADTSADVDHYIYKSYNDAAATNLRFTGTYTTTSKTATNVGDATYWWRVAAVDKAGNVSAWSPLWKITVDNTAPMVSLSNYNTNNNVITPIITASDVNSPLTYLWVPADTASANNVTISDPSLAAPTFTVNSNGTYNFTVTTTDPAGNSTTKTFSFTYTMPVTPLGVTTSVVTSPSRDSINTGTANFANVALTNSTPTTGTTDSTTGVLGVQTQKPTDAGKKDVLGATITPKKNTEGQWQILGLTWYWWLPIVAIAAGVIWWFVARRNSTAA